VKGKNPLKSITYQITDRNGIHARPAGIIVQCAKRFASEITVEKDGESADAKKLFALMRLGVKFHHAVRVMASGADEEEAVQSLYNTMREAGL
jgi:phosphocarrier protein